MLGGAALSAALAFSAPALLGQSSPTYAQTAAQATSTATPGTSTTTATTPATQSDQPNTGSGSNNSAPLMPGPGGPAGDGGPAGGPPHGPAGGPGGLTGTISAINGNTITLKQSSVIAIEATVNDNTAYTEAGKSLKLSDLAVGEKISLRTTASSDGTESIANVQVVLDHAGGTISAIDSGSLTLTRADGSTTKVSLGSSVSVQDLGKTSAVSNLKSGQKIEVAGQLGTDGTLAAQVINVQYDHLGGKVTAISGNSITVEVGLGPDGKAGPPAPPAPPAAQGNGSSQGTATAGANSASGTSSATTTPTTGSTSASPAVTTTTRTITVSDSTLI